MQSKASLYVFQGVVRPERARLDDCFSVDFENLSGLTGSARVRILVNQVVVWTFTDSNWDVYTLRNAVKNIVQNRLAIIGFLKGYAYELEIIRVFNDSKNIDEVFGIDVPCISERNDSDVDLVAVTNIAKKMQGDEGVFIGRCLSDLMSALKNADDTGFYCYRAIESLRHHCAMMNALIDAKAARQWECFRTAAGCSKDDILAIKAAADAPRHGAFIHLTDQQRSDLLLNTWDIVEAYMKNVS